MDEKILYRLNERVSFRKCSLADGDNTNYGDCTNFHSTERNWRDYYCCNQDGIHFHCTEHPEIELDVIPSKSLYGSTVYRCQKCNTDIEIDNPNDLKSKCLRMLNIPEFKEAKLIRLDDWYVHEIRQKIKGESGYWVTTQVKTDRDGDTIIVIYVGHKDEKAKAQFFVKPEKGQLTSDHKDLDPAKLLSKIELTLKNRRIVQEYENL